MIPPDAEERARPSAIAKRDRLRVSFGALRFWGTVDGLECSDCETEPTRAVTSSMSTSDDGATLLVFGVSTAPPRKDLRERFLRDSKFIVEWGVADPPMDTLCAGLAYEERALSLGSSVIFCERDGSEADLLDPEAPLDEDATNK